MNFFKNILVLALIGLSALVLNSRAYANGGYDLSCTNEAYGVNQGSNYLNAGVGGATGGSFTDYGVYAGLDCAYAGGGRTNSSVIVGGEIARAAANAVVGAVSGRLSSAMNMNSDTAAHMSYSTNGNGIGMAANRVFGGLSIWTNYSDSDFDNDQTFTSTSKDAFTKYPNTIDKIYLPKVTGDLKGYYDFNMEKI